MLLLLHIFLSLAIADVARFIRVCMSSVESPSEEMIDPRFFGTVRTFYNNNESCSWRIQGPRNKRVQLHFITFSLEYGGETCPYDKVKIYDGRDSKAPLIGTFCGVVFPRVITSSKNALFVIFLTDTRVTSTGFKIRYSIVDHQGDNGDKSHVPCKEALKAVRDKPFKIFKPSCNKKGEYKRKQCHWWAFRCFCVDPTTGVEIKGTNFSIRRTRFPVICGSNRTLRS
ncbi:hypothetical protein LSAT2_013673 [Lamellibrachia satsuma]|nr:hypothetical protein LSAT2_013673 [Lamellibrachia satsuma]